MFTKHPFVLYRVEHTHPLLLGIFQSKGGLKVIKSMWKTKQNKRKKPKPDLVYLMQLHVKKKMDWNEREKETLFAHHTYSFFLNRVGEHCLTHKGC